MTPIIVFLEVNPRKTPKHVLGDPPKYVCIGSGRKATTRWSYVEVIGARDAHPVRLIEQRHVLAVGVWVVAARQPPIHLETDVVRDVLAQVGAFGIKLQLEQEVELAGLPHPGLRRRGDDG